jgi:hypothetical protein
LEGYYFFEAEMRRTLSNLAADAIEQARYLTKELGVGPLADERALEFDNISSRVWQAVEEDLVSAETASAIRALNGVLQAMSGEANERLWSIAGLQSPEWDAVRRHARAALDLYNADLTARRGEQGADMPQLALDTNTKRGWAVLRRAAPSSTSLQAPQSVRREGDGEGCGHAEGDEGPDPEEDAGGVGDPAAD